jgi:hypothetical protein
MRDCPWIGHVTSCIAGKRTQIVFSIRAGQTPLSKGDHAGEQGGEQNHEAPAPRRAEANRPAQSGAVQYLVSALLSAGCWAAPAATVSDRDLPWVLSLDIEDG